MLDNSHQRQSDKGVFNACGGNLTLINVNILMVVNVGCHAQGDATVTMRVHDIRF